MESWWNFVLAGINSAGMQVGAETEKNWGVRHFIVYIQWNMVEIWKWQGIMNFFLGAAATRTYNLAPLLYASTI